MKLSNFPHRKFHKCTKKPAPEVILPKTQVPAIKNTYCTLSVNLYPGNE